MSFSEDDHPTIGDWWFDGPNNILECSATNVLNIALVTAVKGSNLNGQWQLATWGSGGQNGDGKRYHDAALSLSLRQDSSSIGVPLRTIPKKVRWDMNRGPSCDEVGFLCIQLRRIGYAMNVTNPNASCHEIACESTFLKLLIMLNAQIQIFELLQFQHRPSHCIII